MLEVREHRHQRHRTVGESAARASPLPPMRAHLGCAARLNPMFWWFERDGEFLRLEVLELASSEFELRLIRADGSERAERFSRAEDLAKRHVQLQEEVTKDGWEGPRGPLM